MKPLPAGDTRDYALSVKQQDEVTPFDLTACTIAMIFSSARKPVLTLAGSVQSPPTAGNGSFHLGPTDSETLAARNQSLGKFDVRVKVTDNAGQTWTVLDDTLQLT